MEPRASSSLPSATPRVAAPREARPRLGEPARDPRGGLAAHRDEALLASLARAHDVAGLELDVVQAQADALGGTHPGRVEQLEDGAVAHAARPARVGRLDERRGDLARQRARQRPRPPRRVHVLRGVARERALAEQVSVEPPHGREPAADAGRAQAAAAQALDVAHDVVRVHGGERTAPEEVEEVGEVAAVGDESIRGRSLLRLQGPEILRYSVGHRVTTSDYITASPARRNAGAQSL